MQKENDHSPVRVVLVQPDLAWEDPEKNLLNLKIHVAPYKGRAEVFIFPELFTTGFTMNSKEFAVSMDSPLLRELRALALELGGVIAGSIIIREKEQYFNRFLWIEPGGETLYYDKRHLFRMGDEQEHYSPGNRRCVFSMHGFRFLAQICYDLRFPVFSRYRGDYDAIIYVANWPDSRQHVWENLLKARAIENQCYVIGVNRTGQDGTGIHYKGGSCVISPTGHLTAWLDNTPGALLASLSMSSLTDFREKFPAWKDADDFLIS